MKTCKCCGRDFNHTNFPYNQGILVLDYACSLRCKKELVDEYTAPKIKKKKERADYLSTLSPEEMTDEELREATSITIGGTISSIVSSIFWIGLIVAFLALGTALGFK